MLAADRKTAVNIAAELITDDPLIAQQGIIYRKYVPLEKLGEGLHNLIFSNEWRFFYYGTKKLAHGYYWSIAADSEIANAHIDKEGLDFADKVATIASQFVNFFVLDIARTQDGRWILVEINDAQCSGISCIDANVLYKNLAEVSDGAKELTS